MIDIGAALIGCAVGLVVGAAIVAWRRGLLVPCDRCGRMRTRYPREPAQDEDAR